MDRKAVKQGLFFIISLNLLHFTSFSQIDTAKIRNEIKQVLKKNGIKNTSFELKITSTNQKGGQTAFVITNNITKNYTKIGTNIETSGIKIANNIGGTFTDLKSYIFTPAPITEKNVNDEAFGPLDTFSLKQVMTFVKEYEMEFKTKDVIIFIVNDIIQNRMITQITNELKSKGYKIRGFKFFRPKQEEYRTYSVLVSMEKLPGIKNKQIGLFLFRN